MITNPSSGNQEAVTKQKQQEAGRGAEVHRAEHRNELRTVGWSRLVGGGAHAHSGDVVPGATISKEVQIVLLC